MVDVWYMEHLVHVSGAERMRHAVGTKVRMLPRDPACDMQPSRGKG